jgi:hypothetical protein
LIVPRPTLSGDATNRSIAADDVDDRVERADLVKMNLIERHAVDRGLHLAKPVEQCLGAVLPASAQRRAVDETVDLRQRAMPVMAAGQFAIVARDPAVCIVMMMSVVVMMRVPVSAVVGPIRASALASDALASDLELRGADAGAGHALGPDRVGSDRQRTQRAPYLVEGNTRIDQRAEHHVAGCPGKAVEIENPQTLPIVSASRLDAFGRTPGSPARAPIAHSIRGCNRPASTSEK